MGRQTTIRRRERLALSLNMDAITTAIAEQPTSDDNSPSIKDLVVLLETPPGDVSITGAPLEYTGANKSEVYGPGISTTSGATDNVGAAQISNKYYIAYRNRTIKIVTMTLANTGVATLNDFMEFIIPDTVVPHNFTDSDALQLNGISTDGTHLYIIDNLNHILKYTTDGTFVSQFDFSTLVPGFVGGHVYTGSDDTLKINSDATAITCDGTNLFVRTVYSLADETLVGAVIFKFTLAGALIRNIVEDTDYYVILDEGSRYSDSSVATNRATCSAFNSGTMTLYQERVWMRFTSALHTYDITIYGLDFTPASLVINNVYETVASSSSSDSNYGYGGILFDSDGNIQVISIRVRQIVLLSTGANRITATSIGIVAEAGDTIIINSSEVVVSQVVSDNVVETIDNITLVALTNAVVTRKTLIDDAISVIKIDPLTYGARTLPLV